jgi:O-antigen/teichoic acid export membrane protein
VNRASAPAQAARLRQWRALLSGERVVAHNLIVGSGTIVAGLLGVAFQALFSHRLQPADYGALFAVVSLITLIGLPAGAFTLLMARESSRDRASGQYAASATLLRRGNRALLLTGSGLALALVLTSPILARFLAVPVELLVAAAFGIPIGMALPLLIGEFQGEQRFVAFSLIAAGQAAFKLAGALALGAIWGSVGIIAGISLATVVIYALAAGGLRQKLSIRASVQRWPAAARYLTIVVPSTLALGVLLSTDVLLVKHFFSTQLAGEYSAVAALGRAIFWGATGVAAVLFPKIVARKARGESGSHLIAASVALVALGGLVGFGLLSISSRALIVAFSGSGYAAAAGYLPWYAIGMTLLGGVAVLIATHQTTGKPDFLAVLLPLTLVEPILIVAFHQNLLQVVQVVDLSMALVFGGLAALYLVEQRGREAPPTAIPLGQPTASPVPQLQVNR